MILRLREGHHEITLSRSEGEQLTSQLAAGAEIIIVKGWTIMRGDIAHIAPGGITKEEMDELDKRALPQPVHERASAATVERIRNIIKRKGIRGLKPKQSRTAS